MTPVCNYARKNERRLGPIVLGSASVNTGTEQETAASPQRGGYEMSRAHGHVFSQNYLIRDH
ncbi:hypothetical protein C0995_010335 [Termitomyces sp. Mi166|nr:hypothetical protein C0995_010335 [Termitomyces sp. Mi166\